MAASLRQSQCSLCRATLRLSRGYATANRKASGNIDNKAASKIDRAKELVYGQSYSNPAALDAARIAQLKKVVPSLEAHETITRAWALHQRNQREAFQQNMKVRFDAMQEALKELEATDSRLFEAATAPQPTLSQKHKGPEGVTKSREGRLDGLFPRQIRVPTENKGEAVAWDSEWRRPGGA